MSAVLKAVARWWHFQWRQWTHYDLGEGLSHDTRNAWRDVREAIALSLEEKETK